MSLVEVCVPGRLRSTNSFKLLLVSSILIVAAAHHQSHYDHGQKPGPLLAHAARRRAAGVTSPVLKKAKKNPPLASLPKPPSPTLKRVPTPIRQSPPPPELPKLPPDLPPPPYPPAPPTLPAPDVGPINSLDDVCAVCSSSVYSSNCYGEYIPKCLQAMHLLRLNVWGVKDRLCSCFVVMANQLLQLCPGLNRAVGYIGNCDTQCYYGPRCPFSPTLYALLSPSNVIATSTAIPVKTGSAVIVLNLLPTGGQLSTIDYHVVASDDLVVTPQSANIYSGAMGSNGAFRESIFDPLSVTTTLKGTSVSSVGFMKNITAVPYLYYVQLDTTAGSLRGQLLFQPHLFSLASSKYVPATCPAVVTLCSALVDLQFSPISVVYTFAYGRAVKNITTASVVQGVAGDSGMKLFDFFQPGVNPPSLSNGVTPGPAKILTLLSAPRQHYIFFLTVSQPFGALRGQFQDVVTAISTLIGANVIIPNGAIFDSPRPAPGTGSGAKGSVAFTATIGGGAVCYSFKFTGTNMNPSYAYIHNAVKGSAGPIAVLTVLPVVIGSARKCVGADPDLTAAIIKNPSAFYVQLYSASLPYGLYRGQLSLSTG